MKGVLVRNLPYTILCEDEYIARFSYVQQCTLKALFKKMSWLEELVSLMMTTIIYIYASFHFKIKLKVARVVNLKLVFAD